MKEKVLKYIIELVFIFIIPLAILATCFKQEKVYDENNNEVGKYLTFDNIFVLTNETKTYYHYEYYDIDEVIILDIGDSFIMNPAISQFTYLSRGEQSWFVSYIYNSESLTFLYSGVINNQSDIRYQPFSVSTTGFNLVYVDGLYEFTRSINAVEISCQFGNIVKDYETYTISDNVVSRLLNSLYDILGITSNWILQFIVVYTLLWLIMWFIWHILYLPLDFICSKLLFDRVDK